MALLSTLTLNTETGNYSGKFKTLTVSGHIRIEFEDNGGEERLPSYRVYIGNFEAGAGWNKTSGKSGNHYIAIQIEDPFIAKPVYMNLIKKVNSETGEETHLLLWSRPEDE